MIPICVHGSDGETVLYLNRAHIVSVYRYEDTTTVYMSNKMAYFVKETPEEILKLLGFEVVGQQPQRAA